MANTRTTDAAKTQFPFSGSYVVDPKGKRAQIIPATDENSPDQVTLRSSSGEEWLLDANLLIRESDQSFSLPIPFDTFTSEASSSSTAIFIPVIQEELRIDKQTVDTGRGVRVRKVVEEHEQVVQQPLHQEELIVEHVEMNQIFAPGEQPLARYEGDTLVLPVLEEILCVEKKFRLKEEVRILRQTSEVSATRTVVLKSEKVVVERFDEASSVNAAPMERLPDL